MEESIALHFLEEITLGLLRDCRTQAEDGTWLYVPDGRSHYQALWTRDFAYMADYAGHLIPAEELRACVEYLLRGLREDGVAPDRVDVRGHAVYSAGAENSPAGEWNLDNGAFLTIAADACLRRLPASQAEDLYRSWSLRLHRALDVIPLTREGLVWNDPLRIHSPYGFTDTIGKSGALFFESLLLWQALHRLAAWENRLKDFSAASGLKARADKLVTALDALWDEQEGLFLAASLDCRQPDVWGNAFALAIGMPLGEKAARIRAWLAKNYHLYMQRGQVRHLPAPQTWQRLLLHSPAGEYQNGAYWATASGWVWTALRRAAPELARRLLEELVDDFRRNGVYECVNGEYRKLDRYVVSGTNILGALRST